MAAYSHSKSDTIADFAGTITGFNSQGSTLTIAATDLVRPSDWNSAHNFYQTISGNTAGSSTASGTNLVFGGTNGITASLSTAAGGATMYFDDGAQPASFFRAFPDQGSTAIAAINDGTVSFNHIVREGPFSCSRADVFVSMTISSSSNSSHGGTLYAHIGLYTRNGSSLSSVSTASQSLAWTNTSGNSSGSINGLRRFSVPLNVNFNGGGDLFYAVMFRTSSANANWFTASHVLQPQYVHNAQLVGQIGEGANSSRQLMPGIGFLSASSAALPGSVAFTQLTGAGVTGTISKFYPNVYFVNFTA